MLVRGCPAAAASRMAWSCTAAARSCAARVSATRVSSSAAGSVLGDTGVMWVSGSFARAAWVRARGGGVWSAGEVGLFGVAEQVVGDFGDGVGEEPVVGYSVEPEVAGVG